MSSAKPEAKLIAKMKAAAAAEYGHRLVFIKHHGSAFAQAGVSDLLMCLDGVFVAIEVKAPESYGGSVDRAISAGPSVLQREFVRKVNVAGGVGGVAASVEQFMDLLATAAYRVHWKE